MHFASGWGPDPISPCLSVSFELDAHGLHFHALNLWKIKIARTIFRESARAQYLERERAHTHAHTIFTEARESAHTHTHHVLYRERRQCTKHSYAHIHTASNRKYSMRNACASPPQALLQSLLHFLCSCAEAKHMQCQCMDFRVAQRSIIRTSQYLNVPSPLFDF